MSTISLRDLVKKYGNVNAVKEVNLDIGNGEFLTILGPSGSGKTTLLTLIAGFEQPTNGSVFINNKNVVGLPPNKRNIGLVFQSYALFPHMTVFDNVAFPLNVRKYPKKEVEKKVKEMLELVHLAEFSSRKINELSGGQQQRVALARAISFNPDILLLDEPMAALDRKLRQMVQIELRQLQQSLGITTICVTHDQEEALTMSDRILVLNHGQVEQVGTPKELYESPSNKFVAEFLGSANLFEGKVVYENQVPMIQLQGGPKINCRNARDIKGGEGLLMVRPEHIKLAKISEGKEAILKAVVKSVLYLGGTVRYQLETAEGHMLNVIDTEHFSEGENVSVSWDTKNSWFITEEESREAIAI